MRWGIARRRHIMPQTYGNGAPLWVAVNGSSRRLYPPLIPRGGTDQPARVV